MTDEQSGPRARRVTVVGAGVIGVSWTALFLARGLRVTVSDPFPDVETRVRSALREIAPTLAQLGLPTEALEGPSSALTFEADTATAVRSADVVQENGPERLDVKQQLWRTVEDAAPANALFVSSSSSLPAWEMAKEMDRPQRLMVGHPFNPPHLVPLIEVVPSHGTDPAVVDRAVAFYRSIGKRPQVLDRETPGSVANRLQAALFRKAVYLVSQGIVSEQALDDVVTSSIGMRWAVAGPFRTFHLGGGAGGLSDFLVHLGPAMEALCPQLGAPSLDATTVELLTKGAADFGGTVADLAAKRDGAVIRVIRALDASGGSE
jgi:ketoreductase RED1